MDSTALERLGALIRRTRTSRAWTQAELGRRADVCQSVVAAVESGKGVRIGSLERVCRALDGKLVLDGRFPLAGDPKHQEDRGHARCVGALRRLFERAGFACATEQEIADGPWRGWIDLVAYDASLRRIVIVEVKTELRDAGALDRQVGRYVRSCLVVARSQGWAVTEIAVAVVILATAVNDAFLIANRHVMDGAFPVRGRVAVACLLGRAPVTGRMLLMLDPRRRGRRSLRRSMADGRRTTAPYRDYGAFVATIR